MAGSARDVMVVPILAVALVIAGAVFWYGPSTPVACGERPSWADDYGHVDGPGGPGFKGCLAPSTANYVLTAVVFVSVLAVTGLVGATVGLATNKEPRARLYLDASGNVMPPPPAD
jgi:hypothetical protein